MEITATGNLTLAYLQKLDRYNYLATALSVLVVALSLLWMLFRIGGSNGTALLGSGAYVFATLLGAFWCWTTAYRARFGPVRLAPRHQLAWLLIGAGLFLLSVGDAFYYYLQMSNLNPFPSLADVFFTLSYPFSFAGLLLIPTRQHFRMRMGLDTLITTLCLLGLSWFFLIGPLYFAHAQHATSFSTWLKLIMGLSYPFWDLMLLVAIAMLVQRGTEPALRSSLVLASLGIISAIWADSAYAYTTIFSQTYQGGTPFIDTFWFTSALLIGLSSLHQYAAIARQAYGKQLRSLLPAIRIEDIISRYNSTLLHGRFHLRHILSYAPLILLLITMIYGEILHDDSVTDGLVIITAITGMLSIVRSFLAMRDNDLLIQEREQQQQKAEHLQHMLAQLTGIIEMEHLRTQALTMMTTEMGFDAAMLLLATADEQPRLFVSAISMYSPVMSWTLQGDNILYHTSRSHKDIVLHWEHHSLDLPAEIRCWQEAKHLSTMVFFPLIYQGNVLGSLGVARRTVPELRHQDIPILKAYCEQVAALLEHARLYQEAREHEAFASALANIATRLNNVIVEPDEINELICEEGAHALQADYAILYGADTNSQQLIPLCMHVANGMGATVPSPSDWPRVQPFEAEAQALHSLQPLLVTYPPAGANRRSGELLLPEQGSTTALVVPSVREQRGQHTASLREMLVRYSVRTAILTPLIVQGDPVGLLVFARAQTDGVHDKRALDSSDLPSAQDFGELASVALTNARVYQNLQELDRMKDQFMVTASHELRTPLTAVQGYIELMAEYDEMLPPDQRREFLQKARRGCEELVVLLGNIMDASRLESDAEIKPTVLKRVAVEEMIESVVVLIEPQLTQEQRTLQVVVPPHLYVSADPIRLRQVLMNICTNALKYSPPGTPVGITASSYGSSIVISVSDKGKGIKPQDQSHLFQRFYRLESDINSPVRGSGLGLYISHHLVEAMGGKIWIESKGIPGEGSTFHIQLPAAY